VGNLRPGLDVVEVVVVVDEPAQLRGPLLERWFHAGHSRPRRDFDTAADCRAGAREMQGGQPGRSRLDLAAEDENNEAVDIAFEVAPGVFDGFKLAEFARPAP